MPEDLPYQVQPQVDQLLAEKENAEALGLTDRVEAADKALDAIGYKAPSKKEKAAEKRAEAAAEDPEAKTEPPKHRSTSKQDSTDK